MPTLGVEELLAGSALTHRVPIPAHLVTWLDADPDDPPEVVLRPLVLADVVRLHKAAGDDGQLASALMVAAGLAEPELTLEQVHALPAGVVEYLLSELNRVSGLSLGEDELEDAVRAPLARACFVLAKEFGWTPDRCAQLTLGQVLLYLEMLGRGERP